MIERCFSHSRIKTFIECPMLYYWSYVVGIEPLVKSKPLAAGGSIADALEEYRVTGDKLKAIEKLKSVGSSEENSLPKTLVDDPMRSIQRLGIILLRYFDEYPDDPKNVIIHEYEEDGQLVKRSEIEFKIPLEIVHPADQDAPSAHDPIFYQGRIDCLYKLTDGIAVMDDKTTSRMGEKYFDQYQANHQVMWYIWVADTLGAFKDSIPRCLINAIYIHPEEFRFKRSLIIKSKPQLEEAKADLINWINHIFYAEQTNNFPRNLSHCEMWGGCPYKVLRDVTKKSLRDRIIAANFKEKDEEHR